MRATNFEVKCREWGHNIGIPMVHIDLDNGSGPKIEDLVEGIIKNTLSITTPDMRKTNRWICLQTSKDGIPTGMGSLISALITCQFDIDLHISNPVLPTNGPTSPAWINKPKTVVVNYTDSGNINYHGLGKNDVILFNNPVPDSLEEGFPEVMKFTPATRWVYTSEEDLFPLVKETPKSRLSWVS